MAAQHRISENEKVNIMHAVILLIIKLKFMNVNKKALSAGKRSFSASYCCIDPSESVKVACMASSPCGFSALLDSTTACGLSSNYPGQVQVESLKNCTRDISRHC